MSKRMKKSNIIEYIPTKIGYDKNFWSHCLEVDRKPIINLRRDEDRKEYSIHMKCDKGHDFYITPYTFFIDRRPCIHCKAPEEIGAINYDPSISEYWYDSYILDQISEKSIQQYKFKCPFCGYVFTSRMIDILNRDPKCFQCKDGKDYQAPDDIDNTIYIFNQRDR